MARLIHRRDGAAGLEPAGPTMLAQQASVSLIVPTRNEAQNIAALVPRAAIALLQVGVASEIIFVDDSDDETPDAIRAQQGNGIPVRLVHRTRAQRQDGLSGAVLSGFAEARGDVLAVMDGDLQHPPEILPRLLDPVIRGESELAVATRYRDGGRVDGLDGHTRRVAAASARHIVHTLVPRTRPVSDPLGGFFVVERSVVEDLDLHPNGCKILLEIVTRGRWTRGHEVPYTLASREHGCSKSGPHDALHLAAYLGKVAAAAAGRVLETAACRVILAIGLIWLAYGYSLRTLVGAWSPSDAATASCLVPLLAVPLFLAFARPKEREPEVRERRVDYALGSALIAVALSVLWIFERHMGVAFWVHRVDLASLPWFVAGVVVILFGTGAAWRLRFPLVFLFLVWPPVLRAVARACSAPLGETTRAILRPLGAWVGDIHVGVDEFTVANQTVRVAPGWNATAIVLVVVLGALACSLVLLRGVTRRLVFVVFAATVAWLVNLGCLGFAIFAGNLGAPALARRTVAPPAIVVASVIALGLVLLGLPRFSRGRRRPTRGPIAVPRLRGAGVASTVVVVAAAGAAMLTADLDRFAPLTDALGGAARVPSLTVTGLPAGYRLMGSASRADALQSSSARRFTLVPVAHAAGSGARRSLQVDALPTHNPARKAVSELRRSYPLAAYRLVDAARVAVGSGVRGEELEFASDTGVTWTALTWVWPVRGDGAQFERVVVSWGDPVTLTAFGARPDRRDDLGLEPIRSFARALVETHLRDGTPGT